MRSRSENWPLRVAAGVLLFVSPGQARRAFSLLPGNPWMRCASNESTNFHLEGKIIKLDAGKLTLSTEENIIFHVSYGEKTELKYQDGSSASPKDLRVRGKLSVEGDLTESGEIVAKRMVI